jgi:hypothetical protein
MLQVNIPTFVEGAGGVITTTGGCGDAICAEADIEDATNTASPANRRRLCI